MSVTCGRLGLYSIATPGGGHELPVEDKDPQELIPPLPSLMGSYLVLDCGRAQSGSVLETRCEKENYQKIKIGPHYKS